MAKKTKKTLLVKKNIILALFLTLLVIVLGFWFLISWIKKDKLIIGESGEKIQYSENKLSKEFPSSFPIYPNSKVSSSWESKDNQTIGISAVFETPDAYSKVVDFYSQNLPKTDWVVSNEINQDGGYIASFKNGEYEGFIGITKAGDLVTISITIAKDN